MRVELRPAAFDAHAELARHEQRVAAAGKSGAAASFVGRMRAFNDGREVQRMQLEHYPGMTEKHLEAIVSEAAQRWTLDDCLLLHRVGDIVVGDAIVVIGAWAAHRGDAMDACRFIIEDLKSKAPLWKKETGREGECWVQGNTSGYIRR